MLRSSDVGRRVVVRRRVADAAGRPRFTDLLGELVAADDTTLAVRPDRGGEVVTVPRGEVEAAKPVPPRRRRISPVLLQHLAADTWPAIHREPLGDWLLGSSAGWTRRANSVIAAGDPGLPLPAAVDAVVAWYRRYDSPARAQLLDESPLDALLAERGWVVEAPALALAAPIDRVRTAARPAGLPPVLLSDTPSEDWLGVVGASKGMPPAARTVLAGGEPTFAEVRIDGTVAAVGRAAIADGHVALAAIEVTPAYRRRGLARQVMAALADAAFDRAHTAFLQVEADNEAAIALYERIGFRLHHRYHYRTAPA